jgi:DNA-directed DNA polymerase III PolC
MKPSYVPLRVRSAYSLLSGTAPVEVLVERLKALGLQAAALTDVNNLYGAVPFLRAMREAGLEPVLGAVLDAEEGRPPADGLRGIGPAPGLRGRAPGAPPGAPRRCTATLLARDRTGYANLCRILSERNLAGTETADWGERFDPADSIARNQEGLFVLTEDLPLAGELAGRLDPGRLHLELVRPGRSLTHLRAVHRLARRLGVPCVATSDAYFAEGGGAAHKGRPARADATSHRPGDGTPHAEWRLHRVMRAVARGALVGDVRPEEMPHPGNRILSPREMARLFAEIPRALAKTVDLARACRLEIESKRPVFPRYPLPEGETPYSYLFRLCSLGLRRRFRAVGPEHLERLTRELEIIQRLGFSEYFVIVGDIVRFARRRGMPVVGRGSGASSIVAYLLGITNVDPVAHGLTFERFLNSSREDCPDLDVDLCWRGRDEVIEHVYRTYGAERVAMISTHCTFQPRSAFREVAKALGVSNDEVNRMSRRVPYRVEESLERELAESPARHEIPLGEEPYRSIVRLASVLLGYPHHLGIHSGGIVIGDRPVTDYVPLEEATKGIVVTQYEMRAIEAIGLVKIDLLGNRAITTIRETVSLLERSRGMKLDPERIPDGDRATARLLSRGRTLSCFQVESPAMRNLLSQLGTRDLGGAIAALSLVRPGPASSGMKEAFVRRAAGAEEVTYLHPSLEGVLGETYGILLYEEDVIRVAAAVAGHTLEEGDTLRRSIASARTEEERRRTANAFMARAVKNGVEPDTAREVWRALARFAHYAFSKAHAAGYGVLAYRSAYLKTHYAPEYYVAVLNNHAGMYPRRAHLEEARRLGVAILHPCVNRSEREFSLEGRAIRVGLGEVKGLGEKTIEAILRERSRRPFRGPSDLVRRVPASFREAEALVLAGALDFTGECRPRLLWRLHAGFGEAARRRGEEEGMFEEEPAAVAAGPAEAPEVSDYDPVTKLRLEHRVLEMTPGTHPMAVLAPLFRRSGDRRARRLLASHRVLARPGSRVLFAGIVSASRRTRTVKGEIMQFLTLEDASGMVECTLFPGAYRRLAPRLRSLGPYLVEGKVEDQYGARTITVEDLEPMPLPGVPGREEAVG